MGRGGFSCSSEGAAVPTQGADAWQVGGAAAAAVEAVILTTKRAAHAVVAVVAVAAVAAVAVEVGLLKV